MLPYVEAKFDYKEPNCFVCDHHLFKPKNKMRIVPPVLTSYRTGPTGVLKNVLIILRILFLFLRLACFFG